MSTHIRGGTVVTMNPRREVLQADVVIGDDGRIARITPHASGPSDAKLTIDASGQIVIPGLIQAHLHLCQTLFRGLAEDRALLQWLRERIWPLEAAHSPRSLRASALQGMAELLTSGTTAVLDMGTVHHTDQLFIAAVESGIRYVGGQAMMDDGDDVPEVLRQTAADSLAESDRLHAEWHGKANGRLRYAYAPRFILSCSQPLLHAVAGRSQQGAHVHTHAAEQQAELDAVRAQLGTDDISYFDRIGLLGDRLTLAHGVWLASDSIHRIAQTGTHIAHCPASNLKLASGLAPVSELRRAGASVALGSDGAACSNRLDIWTQMSLAALVATVRDGPGAVSALEVFEMATLGGAAALGLADQIGSIEVAKRGDLTIVNAPWDLPQTDVYTALVHSTSAADVSDVLVDGSQLVRRGELLTLDSQRVAAASRAERTGLLDRVSFG
ncbi:MAG: amidohydrolase family protein [Chloroflexota bacterium]